MVYKALLYVHSFIHLLTKLHEPQQRTRHFSLACSDKAVNKAGKTPTFTECML